MKWILIILLIVIVMIIAMSVSRQYREKYEFYSNLKSFLEQFKINISFRQSKIGEFLSNVKPNKIFDQFITSFQEYIKTGEFATDRIRILDSDEIIELEMIIKGIGRYDVKNELLQIDAFLETINMRLDNATKDKEKLCPMIIKLSLLFAIGVAILLI